MRIAVLSMLCALTAACSDGASAPSDGQCSRNEQCRAGEVCIGELCAQLCTSDLQCPTGQVCQAQTCAVGARQLPTISTVSGNGSAECVAGTGANCIGTGLLVQGTNLVGAEFRLESAAARIDLIVESSDAYGAELLFPDAAALGEGDYYLTAVNSAGSTQTGVQLLQGPPGPAMTPDEMLGHLNSATGRLALALLPVGRGAADVAPGEHTHAAAEITAGTLDSARLPTHSHPDATPSASGMMSATDKSKLDAYSEAGTIQCRVEYDLYEQGTTTKLYRPTTAKRAELLQHGWVCWNRTDDGAQIGPLTDGIHLNQYYNSWNAASQKVCGRLTWLSDPSDANVSYLSLGQSGYYFGLRLMDGVTNTWHGRWQAGAGEGSGGVGTGDRWTIYTCR